MQALADKLWYQGSPWYRLLLPLSWLFAGLSALRRRLYHWGLLGRRRMDVPVIVVGNITVGGVGKTPLVIDLVARLRDAGWRPGVISRGYGGKVRTVSPVTAHSDPAQVGDEPVMIAQATGCQVAVAPQRVAAARLLQTQGVNIIVADDGLQHYALERDLEIIVLDGKRRLGNGQLLPAGPLREGPQRLKDADLVLVTGDAQGGELAVEGQLGEAEHLMTGERRSLDAFQRVCAVAGIGDPEKFFRALRARGLEVTALAFPDHHAYRPRDLKLPGQEPILMTEKDAVKCRRFQEPRAWAVHYQARLPEAAWQTVQARVGSPPRRQQ